jgi:hypothetical protein
MYLYFSLEVEQRNKGEPRPVVACCLTRSAFCSTLGTGGTGRNGHIWSLGRTQVCYGCLPANLRMATSASQTYIARLGFQDRDRSSEQHGLACEYLFERMIELEVAPFFHKTNRADFVYRIEEVKREITTYESNSYYKNRPESQKAKAKLQELEQHLEDFDASSKPSDYIAEARDLYKVGNCVNVPIVSRSFVNGFADVLIDRYHHKWLGEVKITKEPAENVLQQINFYLSYLDNVDAVYILTDYDPGDLKRLCFGTKIKVYRLGQVFQQWLASRTMPATEEL